MKLLTALICVTLALICEGAGVYARYRTSSGSGVPSDTNTIVDFELKDYDSHSAATTGGGWRYTAPETGLYRLSGMIHFSSSAWNAGPQAELNIYKNGAFAVGSSQPSILDSTAMFHPVSLVTEVWLVQGDYIDFRAYQNTGAYRTLHPDGSYNWVAISKAR